MTKVTKCSRFSTQPKETSSKAVILFKGILVSLFVAMVFILLLTIISLMTENLFVQTHMRYIMIGVNIVSVFVGSAFAAQRSRSAGLLIGMGVGAVYVLISLAIGMEISREYFSFLVLVNKFIAGMAVGALGGFIGVNL